MADPIVRAANLAQQMADDERDRSQNRPNPSFYTSQNIENAAKIVRGVTYAIAKDQAIAKGWNFLPPEQGEGNDRFVKMRPVSGVTRAYLKGTRAECGQRRRLSGMHLARVPACTKDQPNTFVNAWEAAGWHSSTHGVLQKRGTRLVALIKEANVEVGRQPHGVSWVGSPQIMEQLIAAIQRLLQAHRETRGKLQRLDPWCLSPKRCTSSG